MTPFGDLADIGRPTREREPFSFAAACRVAFSDTDAQGVVYYGRYAPYFDLARVEYFRHLGLQPRIHDAEPNAERQVGDDAIDGAGPASGHGGEFVMRHFDIDYHAPAVFDDMLVVFCRIERIGNSSVTFEYAVTRPLPEGGEELLATARQVLVWIDVTARQSMRVPERIRTAVTAFEGHSL